MCDDSAVRDRASDAWGAEVESNRDPIVNWYAWSSNGGVFATVTGIDPQESLLLTPNGREQALKKKRVRLRCVLDERGNLPLSDFPHVGLPQPMVLSERAWRILADWLSNCGERVDATIDGMEGDYCVWFPSRAIHCLDEERSEFIETLSGYRTVTRPWFDASAIPARAVFVLAGFEQQDIWVDESFRSAITAGALRGSQFRLKARGPKVSRTAQPGCDDAGAEGGT